MSQAQTANTHARRRVAATVRQPTGAVVNVISSPTIHLIANWMRVQKGNTDSVAKHVMKRRIAAASQMIVKDVSLRMAFASAPPTIDFPTTARSVIARQERRITTVANVQPAMLVRAASRHLMKKKVGSTIIALNLAQSDRWHRRTRQNVPSVRRTIGRQVEPDSLTNVTHAIATTTTHAPSTLVIAARVNAHSPKPKDACSAATEPAILRFAFNEHAATAQPTGSFRAKQKTATLARPIAAFAPFAVMTSVRLMQHSIANVAAWFREKPVGVAPSIATLAFIQKRTCQASFLRLRRRQAFDLNRIRSGCVQGRQTSVGRCRSASIYRLSSSQLLVWAARGSACVATAVFPIRMPGTSTSNFANGMVPEIWASMLAWATNAPRSILPAQRSVHANQFALTSVTIVSSAIHIPRIAAPRSKLRSGAVGKSASAVTSGRFMPKSTQASMVS